MRLDDAPESSNVSDNRGMGGKLAIGGGAGGILLLILGLIFGVDIGGGQRPAAPTGGPPDEATAKFTRQVLGTTEAVWKEQFQKMGVAPYRAPKLELFSERVRTGCGVAPSEVGPFYCPADEKVYIDPTFFDELEQKLRGSAKDFSKAYVIAHEVGHHVQKLLGYHARANDNDGSIRLELQADYLAGVWANHADRKYRVIEPGDVEEAIKSAQAIGDDRLQKRSGGFVHPEKFTHGTSRQRVYFFTRGLKTGDASKATLDKFFSVPMSDKRELQEF